MKVKLACIARYFLVGIDAGICTDDEARAWAFAVIDALDAPPGEIVEISWNKPRANLREDLLAVTGVAELETVGHWLLGLLRLRVSNAPDASLRPLLTSARHIVNATGLGEPLLYNFEQVEDELSLAEQRIYGTIAKARASLAGLLAEFMPPAFCDGWAGIIFEP